MGTSQITIVHARVRRQEGFASQQDHRNSRHDKREPKRKQTVPLQQLLLGPLGSEDDQKPDIKTHTSRKGADRQGDELFHDTRENTARGTHGIRDDSVSISKDEERLVDVVEDCGDTEDLEGIVDRSVIAVAYEKDEKRDADILEDQVESSFTGHDLLSSIEGVCCCCWRFVED